MSVSRVDEVDPIELGASPHWDETSQSLYFVDILGNSIHKYTPATGQHTRATVGDEIVTFIVPVAGKPQKFLLGYGRKIISINWDGVSNKIGHVNVLDEVDVKADLTQNRISDGKCDSSGRLWFGTMGPQLPNGQITKEKGTLYSLDAKHQTKIHVKSISISNGLCWNKENTKFYFIDSLTGSVDEFDYVKSTGTIKNRNCIFNLPYHMIDGLMDGMTIDEDGNLWVAVFDGSKVLKIDPRTPETLLQAVQLPAKQVTSVAFGGPELDVLYVTTARLTVNGVTSTGNDGSLYMISDLGVKGLPMHKYV